MDNEHLYHITGDKSFAINAAYEYEFGLGSKPKDLKKGYLMVSQSRGQRIFGTCKNTGKTHCNCKGWGMKLIEHTIFVIGLGLVFWAFARFLNCIYPTDLWEHLAYFNLGWWAYHTAEFNKQE